MEIKGYENYTISETGDVWNTKFNKFLKSSISNNGYLYVGLHKNGKQKNLLIHRLLGLQFIPNPENKPEIDHIDRNPSNNSLTNLRWATRSEQCENKYAIGEISHKLICYKLNNKGKYKYKYYQIVKKGYFKKYLNVEKFTLQQAIDMRTSLLILHKLPVLLDSE